ncbi:MAG: 16S rRNA (cytosine(1402)-N(4))-methyltransferase, partial [Deltaproteobacteria bacterium]|nr:16S rRNA (cytosine(1402)-N(4))-methyltransferase [Deltaproteobacteria bacterium]
MEYIHQPVMLAETMAALQPTAGGRYVDGTIGGGGHSRALLELVGPHGLVLGLDRDPKAIEHLTGTLGRQQTNLVLRQANFADVDSVLMDLGWPPADGMLVDLGISSWQLEGSERGFSFNRPEPLDMRMDPDSDLTAA